MFCFDWPVYNTNIGGLASERHTKMKIIGLREMKITYSHTKENPGAYFIRYNIDSDIKLLYRLIYEGVEPNAYYSRKHEIFDKYFKSKKQRNMSYN